MRFRKVYLEISNICNLKCSFCPGTNRKPERLTEENFRILAAKLRPWSDFLYFHLMGEPLLHPDLSVFLAIAGQLGFKVILTTNGTLLKKQQNTLLESEALHKVNISLHSFEANCSGKSFDEYLNDCFSYGNAVAGRKLTVYRLWNKGGLDSENQYILNQIEKAFPKPWKVEPRGTRIADRTYLEYGDKFDWPDLNAPQTDGKIACYGLRDQIGVLCDGTVVPCCLDHEGDIPLGNLFTEDMETILKKPESKVIYNGFLAGTAVNPLCERCGYAKHFHS